MRIECGLSGACVECADAVRDIPRVRIAMEVNDAPGRARYT
jgi:hypothetical protein